MRRVVLMLASVVLMTVVGSAQQTASKPNFSGTWVQTSPDDGGGGERVIIHDATTLKEQHAADGPDHRMEFILDGKEHETEPVDAGSGHAMTGHYKATWTGAKLVIEQVTDYQNGFHREATQTWTLDGKGQLVIDLATNLPDGSKMQLTIVSRKK